MQFHKGWRGKEGEGGGLVAAEKPRRVMTANKAVLGGFFRSAEAGAENCLKEMG